MWRHTLLYFGCAFSSAAFATLQPLSEAELEATDGQAFITIDQYNQGGLDFTRVNLGADVKIQMNADEVVYGEYARAGETASADIELNNFSLGHIDNQQIVPFEMRNPYFEFAVDKQGGANDVVGMRFGFDEVKGSISFDATSFTGNIELAFSGDYEFQTTTAIFNFPIALPMTVSGDAVLVDSAGNPDPVRADTIGLPNGTTATIYNQWHWLSGDEFYDVPTNNCELQTGGGSQESVCAPLADFRSFYLGSLNAQDEYEPVKGFFLSFQDRDMSWGHAGAGEAQVQTVQGAFFNVPGAHYTGETSNGEPVDNHRLTTEFIDRGVGRF